METAQRRQTISKLSRIPGYSGGGLLDGLKKAVGITPETPEMKAYKAESAAARAAAKAAPAPAATPSAPAQAGISGYAANSSLAGREKAAGLAKGSKIKPGMAKAAMAGMGGMLKGPGTPTSDDIPAVVVDTGEPIKVATQERIVSKKGNKALEREAKEQGYASLDAKLEAMTGVPVGPTLKYEGGTKTGSAEPIQHASLGGFVDTVKRAVGLAPPETLSQKFARQDAERAAKAPKPAAAPASASATGVSAGLDGAGGNSMARREKEAGLASGGRVTRNMARQRLGDISSVPKKKVSGRPAAPKRQQIEDPEQEDDAAADADVGLGTVMGVIPREPSLERKNPPQVRTNITVVPGSDAERLRDEGVPGYSGGGIMGEINNGPVGTRGAPPGLLSYSGGGLMGMIEANPVKGFNGIPVEGPKYANGGKVGAPKRTYSGGGLMGAIEKEVSSYIKGTPSYSAGGTFSNAYAAAGGAQKPLPGRAMPGKPMPGRSMASMGTPMAGAGTPMESAGTPMESMGTPMGEAAFAAGGKVVEPQPVDPGVFDNTRSIALEAMRDIGEQYDKGNVSGAIGRAARGYAATNVAGLVDAANAVGRAVRPVANVVSNVFTGEDMGSGAAPAPQPAATAPRAGPAIAAPGTAAAPAAPATIPAGPNAAARLRGMDGGEAGDGVAQFDLPGKSPLLTNMTDATGMASNERLVNRAPMSAQNQSAMDGIQGRQDAADTARARMAQYNAEVAGARAINGAAPAYDPEAGARALTDFRSPTSRALANLSTRDKNGKLAPGAERMMAELYKQTLAGPQTVHIEDQRNTTARRGQDLGAQTANAQTQIQRQRLGLETTQDQRAAKQAERAERAQRRIESLYDDYANADEKDKPKLAEQLRVMTGKDKPEQWQAIALQGSTDAMGNKTEGVLAAVNKSTGEMRKLDQGKSIATDPRAIAIRDNKDMTREQKLAELKKMGYQ